MKENIQQRTSNLQRPTLTRPGLIGCSLLDVCCWMFSFPVAFLAAALTARGQTNALPALLPPYGELPPTFWEQHATASVFAGIGILALLAFALWRLLRPKSEIVIPPATKARRTLTGLLQQPEDGATLSGVSQAVRHYFIAAFQMLPGEFTTDEFTRLLARQEVIGAELSTATVTLLQDCDQRKFSATSTSAPIHAVDQALQLIAQAEQRRAQLQPPTSTQPQGGRA